MTKTDPYKNVLTKLTLQIIRTERDEAVEILKRALKDLDEYAYNSAPPISGRVRKTYNMVRALIKRLEERCSI